MLFDICTVEPILDDGVSNGQHIASLDDLFADIGKVVPFTGGENNLEVDLSGTPLSSSANAQQDDSTELGDFLLGESGMDVGQE